MGGRIAALLLALAGLVLVAQAASAQTPASPSLTLSPGEVSAGSLNGAKITITPEGFLCKKFTEGGEPVCIQASFLGANKGSGQGGGGNATFLTNGQLNAAGKAEITLSGAPTGLTISDAKLLARTTKNGRGHRSVEITLAYTGDPATIVADDAVTINVSGGANSSNEFTGLLRFMSKSGANPTGFTELIPASLSASFTIKPGAGTTLPVVTIAPASSTAAAEGSALAFTVSADPQPSADLTVNLTVEDAPNADFVASDNEGGGKSVTISANTGSKTFWLATVGDTTDEPSGPVKVTVNSGTGYTVGDTDEASRTVNDNDTTAIALTGTTASIEEGETKTFTLAIGRGLYGGETLAVPLTFGGTGTRATRGSSADYTLACASATGVTCASMNSGTATVTFTGPSSGQTATSVTITLTARSDGTADSGETVNVGMGTPSATGLGGGTSKTDSFAQFVIYDPGATPEITIAPASSAAATEGSALAFTVSASPAPAVDLTVNLTVEDAPKADFVAADDEGGGKTVTINANSGSATFWLATVGGASETEDEPSGAVKVTVNAGTGYTVGTTDSATRTVNDNDKTAVTLVGTTESVEEHEIRTFGVRVGRQLRDGEAVTVGLDFTHGTTSAADFSVTCQDPLPTGVTCTLTSGSEAVKFTGGAGSATSVLLTISPTGSGTAGDGMAEPGGETLNVNQRGVLLTTGLDGGASFTDSFGEFVIYDPGTTPALIAPIIIIKPPAGDVDYFNEGGTVAFTVSASPRPAADLTVNLTVEDAPNADFVASGNEGSGKTVVIKANTGSAIFSLATVGDSTDEPSGAVKVKVNGGTGYTVGGSNTATMRINDVNPTAITLTGDTTAVGEGSTKTFTLAIGRGLYGGETLAVPLTFGGTGTQATRGTSADFTLACPNTLPTGVTCANMNSGTATVTFTGSGSTATATSVTITLTARSDGTADSGETVNIGMGTPTATGLNGGTSKTDSFGQFVFNDTVPIVTIAPKAASAVTEGSNAVFTVSASPQPKADLTVNLTVEDAPHADFVASGNEGSGKTVVIAANTSSKDFTVATVGGTSETEDEPSGAVTVTVNADTNDPAKYTVGSTDSASRTVTDDDPTTSTLTGTTASIEEGESKTFTVSIGRALRTGESLFVPITFAGTAVKGTDYALTCGAATGVSCERGSGNEGVTFSGSAGGSATSVTWTLSAVDEGAPESGGDTVNVNSRGSGPSGTGLDGGAAALTDSFGEFRIYDIGQTPGSTPVVTIAPKAASAVTEGTDAVFTVSASPQPTSALTVNLTVEDAPNADFVSSTNQGSGKTVTIAANTASADFTVATAGGASETEDEPSGPVKVTVNADTNDPATYTVGSTNEASRTVTDDDETAITLTGDTIAVSEGGTKDFTLAVGRGLVNGETLAVPLTFGGTGTQATRGSSADYTLACASATGVTCATMNSGTATVTFTGPTSGQTATSVTITLTARSDGTTETGGETVDIGMGTPTATGLDGGTSRTDSAGQFKIEDPGPVTLSVSVSPDAVDEGAAGSTTDVTITVRLSRAHTSDVDFRVCLGGTATRGSSDDYQLIYGDHPTTVEADGCSFRTTIVAGGTEDAYHKIRVIGDAEAEHDETVVMKLTSADVSLGTGSATLTIRNDDGTPPPKLPVVTVAPKASTAVTEGGNAVFTVSASPQPAADMTVNLTVDDAANADFVASSNQGSGKTVVIAANTGSKDFTVATVGDGTDEPDGAVTVTVNADTSDPAKYTVGDTSEASRAVNDNDATTVTLTGDTTAVAEGSTKDFTLSIGRGLYSGETLAVPLTFGGTGTQATRGASADYTLACASAAGVTCANMNAGTATVTFTGPSTGQTATSVTITLTARSDGTADSGETVNVGLGAPTETGLGGGTSRTDSFGQFTVNDPPSAPTVSLASAAYSVTEGNAVSITVNINPQRGSPTAVGIVYANGTAGSGDYSASPATVTIPANTASATFTVQTTEDTANEPDETFTVSIGTVPNGVATGSPSQATVTIDDDDTAATPGALVFSSTSYTVDEGETAEVKLVLGEVQQGQTEFVVEARLGSASAFDLAGAFQSRWSGFGRSFFFGFAIPPGQKSKTIRIQTAEDSSEEGDETLTLRVKKVTVKVNNRAIGTLVPPDPVTLTIRDDDGVPATPVASFASAASSAGEGSGTRNVTVNLDPAPRSAITLGYTVGGTAGSADFSIAGSGTVSVPSGAGSVTIPVAITDDTAEESSETVVLTLTGGTGYTVGTPAAHTLTIADDDTPATPVASFASAASSAGEGSGTRNVTVNLDPAPQSAITLSYTVGGTAQGADFSIASSGTVSVSSGTGSVDIPVAIVNDAAQESSETVVLTLTAGSGYTVGSPGAHTLTIADDDTPTPPVVSFASATSSAGEASGTGNVTVNLAPAPQSAITLSYTVGGTAQSADFSIAGSGSISVSSGAGSVNIPVAITDDTEREAGETVVLTLTAGSGYSVGSPGAHTLTITDDDAAQAPIAQCAASLPSNAVSVPEVEGWRDDPNHSGNQDHIDRWSRVLKALDPAAGAGTAMTASDAQTWADLGWARWVRTVDTLEAIEQCLAGTTPPQVPEIAVSAGPGVTEGSAATFTLTATPAPSAPLTVEVTVTESGGYATAGTHQVTIPTGGTATLTVATVGDSVDEPDGSVTATLAAGTGYTVSTSANAATVAVADDDTQPGTQSPIVQCAADLPSNAVSVSEVEGWRDDPNHVGNQVHIDRWNRVLKALDPSRGAGTAMTAADAQAFADRGWGRWVRAAATIEAIEQCLAGTTPTPPPSSEVSITAGSDVTEGGDAAFTVTADPAPAANLTVSLNVSEAANSDFVASGNEGAQSVTIQAGQASATFTVTTVDDGTDEPDGSVTATLAAGTGYTVAASPADAATVAVADNDVAGALTLSIVDDDLEATEHGVFEFRVRLSASAPHEVRVRWAMVPVTVKYRDFGWSAHGGLLRFSPGTRTQTIYLFPEDDSHDEGEETFKVVLSNAVGATIADGEATGTIVNDDPLPAAWLARFGRTVAEQALDGIAGRMESARTPGMRGSLGGQALAFGPWRSGGAPSGAAPSGVSRDDAAAGRDGAMAGPGSGAGAGIARAFDATGGVLLDGTGHRIGERFGAPETQTMTGREVLLSSNFTLTGERDAAGGSMAFWGRAAHGSFDGRDGGTALDGEVTTGMLGADYARDRWLVGLALAQSEGEGGYRDRDAAPPPVGSAPASLGGTVESSLTAAIPYASVQASERLKLWSALGYGAGEVTLTPEGDDRMTADTEWAMAAAGVRGDLLAPSSGEGGPALALVSDALWARTSSDQTTGLMASDSDVTRLRLGLEGSWRVALDGDASLTPKLEIGARHDGGDAETGFGVELGGGIAWVDPNIGLSLDVEGRTLIAHEDGDLEDRGFSAALAFDPDPATERGLSLSLRQEFGGQAQGGLDALFATDPLSERTGSEAESLWTAEAAYGFPAFGGRFTASPHVGVGLSDTARDYSLGWRWSPADNAPALSFGLKATLRESDTARPEHAAGFEVSASW